MCEWPLLIKSKDKTKTNYIISDNGENEAMRDYNLTGEVWECFPKEGLFNKEKINLFCIL